jgi:hypothetical protein
LDTKPCSKVDAQNGSTRSCGSDKKNFGKNSFEMILKNVNMIHNEIKREGMDTNAEPEAKERAGGYPPAGTTCGPRSSELFVHFKRGVCEEHDNRCER